MPCSARVASFARLMAQCELTTPRRRRPDSDGRNRLGPWQRLGRDAPPEAFNLPCLQSEHCRRGNSEPILRRHPRCRRTISQAGARSRSFHGKRAPVSLAANCNILGQDVTPRPRFERDCRPLLARQEARAMRALRGMRQLGDANRLRVSFRRLRSARPQRRLPPGGLPPFAFAPITPSQRRAGRRPTPGHAQSGPAQAADGEDTTARRRAGDPPPP
jgi:hypothetical protein